ncbi:MAG: RNA polymerase sigma factor [Isosphaeraceae bacterium]
MAARRAHAIGRSLDTLFRVGTLGSLSDGELLECLTSSSDAEEAFRAIVERHAPMVLGLCRSLVKDAHEAEDAFQATFMVLVRKAGSIRRRDTIGPWLYGVAGRIARKARARSARRGRIERPLSEELPARDDPAADCATTLNTLHEEIARLPEPLRVPLVLCCLEGMCYDTAARSLGVTEPTLRGRLHRARKRLAVQLRGRGIHASALGASFESSRFLLPPVSPSLVESTVHLSLRWSSISGLSTGAVAVPDAIATLAQGVIRMMMFQAYKASAVGLLVGAGLLGTVVLAQQGSHHAADQASGNQATAKESSTQNSPQAQPAPKPHLKTYYKLVAETTYSVRTMEKQRQLDAKTRQIRERLKQEIVSDRDDLPLDELLKHIKQSTADAAFPGIPIYVDPVGLQDANAGIASRVQIPKKGSVEFVLSFALRELRLSYTVQDGFLMISSRDDITDRKLNDLDDKVDRILRALERLEKTKM